MKISLIRIGNSQGIRLPQALIKQCGFSSVVEVSVKNKVMTIRCAESLRDDWEDYIKIEQSKNPIDTQKEWIW